MKKLIGIGLILALFIPLAGQESLTKTNKEWKPDLVFYSLATANFLICTYDMASSLDKYRKHKADEANPIVKYFFDNCPWGLPVYMIGGITTITTISYLINKIGFRPLGYIILGGMVLTEGYIVYLNFRI